MRNYFIKLRWKMIRANNLLQFIYQVTKDLRFRKSLAQERFKSNLEFRYQIKNTYSFRLSDWKTTSTFGSSVKRK